MVTSASDPGSRSSSTWTGSGPASRSPRHASTAGKPHARSSAHWSPTAADRSPAGPRRHAARHNHRGWRHRPGYDQIQPPTAASNDQIQAGDLSAAPQSRAWTADNTGLPRLQRSRSYCVAAVSDIWLGCLAPRKSGRGEMAASHQAVRAVSASSRMRSMHSIALMPSSGDRLAPSAGSWHVGRSEVCGKADVVAPPVLDGSLHDLGMGADCEQLQVEYVPPVEWK